MRSSANRPAVCRTSNSSPLNKEPTQKLAAPRKAIFVISYLNTDEPASDLQPAGTLAAESGGALLLAQLQNQVHNYPLDSVAHLAMIRILHRDGVRHAPFQDR